MLSKYLFKKLSFTTKRCATYLSPSDPEQDIKTPYAQRPGTGGIRHVTAIPGQGIGPELTDCVQRVFAAVHAPITWDLIPNFDINDPDCKAKLRKNECILLGMLSEDTKERYMESTKLYKYLDLYANLIHTRTIPNISTRHKNVDIVILRENTEGEYSGIEHEVYPGVIESVKIITKAASLRLAEYAFEFAYLSGRSKVTAVHKANIMKLCDGTFLEATREIAKRYPFIKYEEVIIDNCCMQMVKNPWQFDVMVMPNLYGSIVSNTAAGICGGPGTTPGAAIGRNYVIFEQGTRHTGSDIVGKHWANPTALILSSVIMLKHMGLPKFASDIERALNKVYKEGKVRTRDIGGSSSSDEFTTEIIKKLDEQN